MSEESTPDQLVGALQDSVHRDLGPVRAASAAKVDAAPTDEKSTQAENELIMAWLGWTKHPDPELHGWWRPPSGGTFMSQLHKEFPTFTTWADAGLILEALRSTEPTLEYVDGKWDCYGGDPFESFYHAYADTGPLAIRAAALAYLRSLP
jgi:hypothetical protein